MPARHVTALQPHSNFSSTDCIWWCIRSAGGRENLFLKNGPSTSGQNHILVAHRYELAFRRLRNGAFPLLRKNYYYAPGEPQLN
jgi:hypothetical protein